MGNEDEHASAGAGSSASDGPWWFNTRHMRVEPASTGSPGKDLLGPYATREEAEHALDKVRERNQAWDAKE